MRYRCGHEPADVRKLRIVERRRHAIFRFIEFFGLIEQQRWRGPPSVVDGLQQRRTGRKQFGSKHFGCGQFRSGGRLATRWGPVSLGPGRSFGGINQQRVGIGEQRKR